MSCLVSPRASASPRSFLGRLALVLAVLASVSFGAAPQARASDGYEVGMLGGGLTILSVGLDVTFIVATATGLTYEDEGWAIAQTTWAIASLAGAGIGMGYAIDAGYDGLVGALVLVGAGSGILLGYAIDALSRNGTKESALAALGLHLGVAPMPDGAMVTLGWSS